MFKLTANVDCCENIESLSERMQIAWIGSDYPDKIFIKLMCDIAHLFIGLFSTLETFTDASITQQPSY